MQDKRCDTQIHVSKLDQVFNTDVRLLFLEPGVRNLWMTLD